MHTALVLTGATRRSQAEASPNPPDYILESLAELPNLIL
jgi:ribonucleotide monophosphatase NagD (HAD superfamily)